MRESTRQSNPTPAPERLPGILGEEHEPEPADDTPLRAVPDLRGVPVEDASGIPTGSVYGALIENSTGLVRYLDLALDSLDRHVLVPIGHARVRQTVEGEPHFRLRAALVEQLEQVPPFPADVAHVDDPFERALLEAYGRSFHGERYYAHPSYDHHGVFAGEHPVVTDATEASEQPLQRLFYLPGWRVARGEPDIRDWDVVLDDNARLTVRDLVVDTTAEQVRYVVVDAPRGGSLRLLPIGYLQLDEQTETVVAAGLNAEDVSRLPAYDGGAVERVEEDLLMDALREQLAGARRYQLADYRPQIH